MEIEDKFYTCEEVPRLSFQDAKAMQLIADEKPVVLTHAHICEPALKWDLKYLLEHIGDAEHVVFASCSNVFKYYDDQKIKFCPQFERPTEKLAMTFKEFYQRFNNWKPGEKKLYLQQSLSSTVGPKVAADFVSFNWLWLTNLQKLVNWGALTSNLLLIAAKGGLTPVHYDEQQNLFCQLIGQKKVTLFSPEHHNRLYPHPVYHPHDRQSQVDLSKPNFSLYPGLRHLHGHEAIVGPGDVLYIPIYWWHQVESLNTHPYTVSLNFWYKAPPADNISYPLLPRQEVVIMRNIEKMIVDVFKEPSQVDHFFQSLTLGRYTVQGADVPATLSASLMNPELFSKEHLNDQKREEPSKDSDKLVGVQARGARKKKIVGKNSSANVRGEGSAHAKDGTNSTCSCHETSNPVVENGSASCTCCSSCSSSPSLCKNYSHASRSS